MDKEVLKHVQEETGNYKKVKQWTGQIAWQGTAVKRNNKDGELLKRTEDCMSNWGEYFQEILNRKEPLNPPQIGLLFSFLFLRISSALSMLLDVKA